MLHFFKAVSLSAVILGSSMVSGSEVETPNGRDLNKRDQELHDACQAVHANIQAAFDSMHEVKEASAAPQTWGEFFSSFWQ